MRDELEHELVEQYPEMYQLYHEDADSIGAPVPPLTTFGFTVGDGWYNLLESISEQLSRLEVDLNVTQVKEKHGGLRFYHDGISHSDERRSYQAIGAIQQAEEMSYHICEECGAAAELRQGGYLRTLCDACHSDEAARRRQLSSK